MADGEARRRRILGVIVGVIIAALNRSPELGATVLVLVIVAALFLPFVARALERRRARTVGDNPMTPFH